MSRRMKTKQSGMKLSQIRRRIELCLREIILRFEMNLQNLLFSWQFHIRILKQVPKYLATGLYAISGSRWEIFTAMRLLQNFLNL
jgi:hypothetical protein